MGDDVCNICLERRGSNRFAQDNELPGVTFLACAHSFCTACILMSGMHSRQFHDDGMNIICPICRQVTNYDITLPEFLKKIIRCSGRGLNDLKFVSTDDGNDDSLVNFHSSRPSPTNVDDQGSQLSDSEYVPQQHQSSSGNFPNFLDTLIIAAKVFY